MLQLPRDFTAYHIRIQCFVFRPFSIHFAKGPAFSPIRWIVGVLITATGTPVMRSRQDDVRSSALPRSLLVALADARHSGVAMKRVPIWTPA